MKGIIFNEFLEFVEKTMSYDMVDKIILKADLPSKGAYTRIGTYNSYELFELVSALHEETNIPIKDILYRYGIYLFSIFILKYPQFFQAQTTVFEFLDGIESHVHIDVKKFYPDADLPYFETTYVSPNQFIMVYTSSRPLADLAEGLIQGCINYHNEKINIKREDIEVSRGTKAKFILTKEMTS